MDEQRNAPSLDPEVGFGVDGDPATGPNGAATGSRVGDASKVRGNPENTAAQIEDARRQRSRQTMHREDHTISDAPTDTTTGPGEGVSAMGGIPAGGGAMAGQNDGTRRHRNMIGGTDTDTGLAFGEGQSTSTGTLPTMGGPNLDGTETPETVDIDAEEG
jgi:hypothetical protein